MTQSDLFTLYRKSDPDTSRIAAEKVAPKLRELQEQVLNVLKRHPMGLTDIELEHYFGNHGSTYRTRRSELVDLGLVRDTGQRRNINGRQRIVWGVK